MVWYLWGETGLRAFWQARNEYEKLSTVVNKERHEIARLERDIEAWQRDLFYVERQAREHLAMGRSGEKIVVTGG